ncbi:uncharacterized protein V6R79_003763 [Siganus canaliculatus]
MAQRKRLNVDEYFVAIVTPGYGEVGVNKKQHMVLVATWQWSPSSSSVRTAATGALESAGIGSLTATLTQCEEKTSRESRKISAVPPQRKYPWTLRWINPDFSTRCDCGEGGSCVAAAGMDALQRAELTTEAMLTHDKRHNGLQTAFY